MQIKSAENFFGTFFKSLFQHGAVDRAVSEGRRAISQRDWWVPTLFLQQENAQLWRPLRLEDIRLDWPERDRLVGRVAERVAIAAALARGEAVIVQGEEGIGKRTLLTHIARRISEEQPRHLFWLDADERSDLRFLMERLVTFVGRRTGQAFNATLKTAQLTPLSVLNWVLEGLQRLKPLLVLNEVDHLWNNQGFQVVLDQLSPLVRNGTVNLLLSAEHLPDLPNKPWRSLLRLDGVAEAELHDVITENGWIVPDAIVGQIAILYQLSAGNPLRLQLLLHRLALVGNPEGMLEHLRNTGVAGVAVSILRTSELSREERVVLGALSVLSESEAIQEAVHAVVGDSIIARAHLDTVLHDLCHSGLVQKVGKVRAEFKNDGANEWQLDEESKYRATTPMYRLRRSQDTTGLFSGTELEAMHGRAVSFFADRAPVFAAYHLWRSGDPALAGKMVVTHLSSIIGSGHLERADNLLTHLPLHTLEPALAAEFMLIQAELRLLALEATPARNAAASAEGYAQQLHDPQARRSINAHAARIRAAFHIAQGDYGAAITSCRPYLVSPNLEQLSPSLGVALYAELAEALYHEGELDEASAAVEAGLILFDQSQASVRLKARLLMRQATIASDRSDSTALPLLQEARDLARAADDLPLLARIRYDLGLEFDQQGANLEGLAELEACRTLATQIGAEEVQTYALLALGQHFNQCEEYPTALKYLVDARDRLYALKLFPGYAHALLNIGMAHFYQEQYEAARVQFYEAAVFSRKPGQHRKELRAQSAIAEQWLGEVALTDGRSEDALRHAERALPRFQKLELISYEAMAHRLRGDSLLKLREVRKAAAALKRAVRCDELAQDPFDHMTLLVSRARLAAAQGKRKEAHDLLREAQERLDETPSPYHRKLIDRALGEL